MNFSNYRFTLDMQKSKAQASIPVHFRDTGNRFYITLTDGGNPYIIGDGCRVDICIKKPNGTPLINSCIIENNALVRYDFNKNTASVEGMHKCELRLYSPEGRLITTPYFIMVVDQGVFYDDEIGTEEDFQKLVALDVIAKEEERRVAEFERWEAEELRALAEKNRVEAEEARASAENARVLAENERGQGILELNASVSDHEERITSNEEVVEVLRTVLPNIDTAIDNHEERISGIEQYLGGDNFIVDDSTAYQKAVPKNACEKAKVIRVGGMSYKSKNMFDSDILLEAQGATKVGNIYSAHSTYLYNTFRGTGKSLVKGFQPATQYTFSCRVKQAAISDTAYNGVAFYFLYDDGTTSTIKYETVFDSFVSYSVTSGAGKNVVGLHFSVSSAGMVEICDAMCCEGTAAIYEPYFPGLRHAKVEAIESRSANKFDISKAVKYSGEITISNDAIVWTTSGTGDIFAFYYWFDCEKNTDYSVSLNATSIKSLYLYTDKIYGTLVKNIFFNATTKTLTFNSGEYTRLLLAFYSLGSNRVGTSETISKVMINKGTTALPYTPFGTIDTLAIPESCRVYRGIDETLYDFLEWKGGMVKPHKRLGERNIGDLNWSRYPSGSGNTYYAEVSTMKKTITENERRTGFLCPKYYPSTNIYTDTLDPNSMIRHESGYIYVRDDAYTDVESFKAAMADVPLIFELAQPVVMDDIADLFTHDNLILVEGGGSIIAVNEHNLPAPTSIKYLVTYPKEAN